MREFGWSSLLPGESGQKHHESLPPSSWYCNGVVRSCFFEGTETSNAAGAGSGPILYDWGSTFVLTEHGELDIIESFSRSKLFQKKNYSRSIVDYYPKNLAKTADKPYLREMGSVMDEFVNVPTKESPNFEERYDHSRYIHWRMTLPEYTQIESMFSPLPKFMKVDEVWMKKCFPGKRSESDWPLNNFFRHAHWRIIVIGERYSSMFLHADGFETATYVIQFVGRKRWMVCSPEEGLKFGDAGLHDLFHPESIDLKAYPSLEHIDCTDTIVKPGKLYITLLIGGTKH